MSLNIDRVSRSQGNRFTSVRLDRLVERRDDERWVASALEAPEARYVPLWRSRNLLESSNDGTLAVYLRHGELDHVDLLQRPTLLGTDEKRTYFAINLSDAQKDAVLETHANAEFADLRRYSIDMDAKHAGILAYAKALHYWQHRHRFCGFCGTANRLRSAGHKMVCSNDECGRQTFPRIDPAIIVLITHQDACLLGRNPNWPARRFSTLAGFVEPGESLEDAVVREVHEESAVRLRAIRYVSSQPWPFPASAMCGFYAEAVSRDCQTSEELEELRWYNPEQLIQALNAGELLLPPPVSISFQLLADWFRQRSGKDLEAVCQAAASAAQGR